ncbi:MAG: GNAT family N-acetyltransferase [Burkholderiaceae bacterium]
MSDVLTVRLLGAGDETVLDCVSPDVFDDPIRPRRLREFLRDDRHHLAVALDGELVVGMASAVHYVHPDKEPELWINEVGVAPSHEGRGVGRRLLKALFGHGRELGCGEAWVMTGEDNAPARRMYAAVGGHESRAMYITFDLSPASEGKTGSKDGGE